MPLVLPDQVRRFRLMRSGLLAPFPSPEAAAAALAGVQAQILPAAAVALWNRTRGLTHSRFEELLFTQRTLVKLWGQRGTLHLYPSADWALIAGMLTNTHSWWGRTAQREGRLDDYSALVEQAAALLRERGVMGRGDLRASGLPLLDDHLSPWGGVFADLVRRGYACHAGRTENEGMFAAREHWLPDLDWDPPDYDMANKEILRRYLKTYGPSTIQDFVYWRGAQAGNRRRWWNELAADIVEVDVAGSTQYILCEDLDDLLSTPADADWPMHMLYRFDPLLLAHKDKTWFVPQAFYNQVWRPAGHIEGVVLVRGQAVAAWRYERKGAGLIIKVKPFHKLTKRVQTQIGRLSKQIAGFFEASLLDVQFGDAVAPGFAKTPRSPR